MPKMIEAAFATGDNFPHRKAEIGPYERIDDDTRWQSWFTRAERDAYYRKWFQGRPGCSTSEPTYIWNGETRNTWTIVMPKWLLLADGEWWCAMERGEYLRNEDTRRAIAGDCDRRRRLTLDAAAEAWESLQSPDTLPAEITQAEFLQALYRALKERGITRPFARDDETAAILAEALS